MDSKEKFQNMIHERIVVGGFGGQGVLLAGHLLSVACMNNGLNVTHIPSYGAEMRGGTASCSVVIASQSIASPLVAEPSIVIVLNRPSLVKFEPILRSGGLLIYNSSLIEELPQRNDIETIQIPATDIARQFASEQAANIACVGKLISLRPELASLADIEATLDIVISERNRKHNPVNKQVLRAGFAFA